MRLLIGGPIYARHAAELAPDRRYRCFPAGSGYVEGRIFAGPYNDLTTTVCLLAGDDGAWFKEILAKQTPPGWWREEGT